MVIVAKVTRPLLTGLSLNVNELIISRGGTIMMVAVNVWVPEEQSMFFNTAVMVPVWIDVISLLVVIGNEPLFSCWNRRSTRIELGTLANLELLLDSVTHVR